MPVAVPQLVFSMIRDCIAVRAGESEGRGRVSEFPLLQLHYLLHFTFVRLANVSRVGVHFRQFDIRSGLPCYHVDVNRVAFTEAPNGGDIAFVRL